jgi:hypothetical protein
MRISDTIHSKDQRHKIPKVIHTPQRQRMTDVEPDQILQVKQPAIHSKTLGALPGSSVKGNNPEWIFILVVLGFVVLLIISWRLILCYAPTFKYGPEESKIPRVEIKKLEPIYPYRAQYNYEPQLEDEIQIRIGDKILVDTLCDDGWAVGLNKSTGRKGAFPFACVK